VWDESLPLLPSLAEAASYGGYSPQQKIWACYTNTMFVGILFAVIVSLSISVFSLLAFLAQRHANPSFWKPHYFFFGLFWLGMSVVWALIATSDFFTYLELRYVSVFLTYVFQVFIGASLVSVAYFLNISALRRHIKKIWAAYFLMAYFLFLLSLVQYHLTLRPTNFFINQIVTSQQTRAIFVIMVVPLYTAAFILLARFVRLRHTIDRPTYTFHVFACVSLLLLGVAGSVDEIGVISGWIVTASRLVSLVSAIAAYIGTLALHEPDELVI